MSSWWGAAMPLAAGAVVVATAWRRRPLPMPPIRARGTTCATPSTASIVVERLGRWAQERLGVAPSSSPVLVGRILVGAAILLPLQPVLAVVVLGGGWLGAWWAGRTAARRRLEAVEGDLPASTDLLAVALLSGCPFSAAVEAVANAHRGTVAEGWRRVVHRVALGGTLDEELQIWAGGAGPHGARLVETLLTARRSGAAVGPALRRLAADHRELARRRSEERARRLPVLLLLPLATCVLPAFVLVAVVPVAIAGAGSIAFP